MNTRANSQTQPANCRPNLQTTELPDTAGDWKLAPDKSGTNSLRAGWVQAQRDRGAGNPSMLQV